MDNNIFKKLHIFEKISTSHFQNCLVFSKVWKIEWDITDLMILKNSEGRKPNLRPLDTVGENRRILNTVLQYTVKNHTIPSNIATKLRPQYKN